MPNDMRQFDNVNMSLYSDLAKQVRHSLDNSNLRNQIPSYKGKLKRRKYDHSTYPVVNCLYQYTYTLPGSFLGVGAKVNIYDTNDGREIFHPLNPQTLACVLDRVNEKCGKLRKYFKNIVLIHDMQEFDGRSRARGEYYGVPFFFSPDILHCGVFCDYKNLKPEISLEEYYLGVEKAHYEFLTHCICCYAKKKIVEAPQLDIGPSEDILKNPYEEYLTNDIRKLYECKENSEEEYDKMSRFLISKVTDCATSGFNDLSKMGVLFFINPEELKRVNPEYYFLMTRLVEEGNHNLYYAINDELQKKEQHAKRIKGRSGTIYPAKKEVYTPSNKKSSRRETNSINEDIERYNRLCDKLPELSGVPEPMVTQYLNTMPFPIEDYNDLTFFWDWYNQEKAKGENSFS